MAITKIRTTRFYHKEMPTKGSDRNTKSEDPDQTAPDLGLHSIARPSCPKLRKLGQAQKYTQYELLLAKQTK